MKQSNTFEILYKPYSRDVMGYILRIADCIYLVVNKQLSKIEADNVEETLVKMIDSHPPSRLIVLKGDGSIQKTDNLDILERAC